MKSRVRNNGQILEEWVDFEYKRRGRQCELQADAEPVKGGRAQWPARPELALIIARGHLYGQLVDGGKYASVNALAMELRMDPSQMMKYLRTRNLAPDIIESILEGKEPDGLKQDDLLQALPLDWEEQRGLLGFPLRHSVTGDAEPQPADNEDPAAVPTPNPPMHSEAAGDSRNEPLRGKGAQRQATARKPAGAKQKSDRTPVQGVLDFD